MKLCFIPAMWRQVGLAALFGWFAAHVNAGIPEPDLVWYGKVLASAGGAPVRVTSGTLEWHLEPMAGGPAIVLTTALTNINDQFSFALRVPCESPEPGVANTSGAIRLTTPPTGYRRLSVTLDGQSLALGNTAAEFSPLPKDRGRTDRIDLHLGTAPVDSDGDGLPDAWELQYFGTLSANPDDDPDGDGLSNLAEFRAGTNPTDAQSRFELIEITEAPDGVVIRWSSQPDRSYRVRRSLTLLAAPSAYEVVVVGLPATPPINQFVDGDIDAGAHYFYLIELEE